VTSGAQSDIEQATRLARAMVTRWGFSDQLGTVMYGENQEEVFLGYSMGRQQNISETTAQTIDAEVRRLIETAQLEARRVLTEKRQDLEALAKGLLEYETLSGDEILGLFRGETPVRPSDDEPPANTRASVIPPAGTRPEQRPDAGFGGLEPQPQA
jgi:cell division protease FtsH